VIDASVAVRWFVYGVGNESAAAWIDKPDLIAPDLIVAEVGNALWLYCKREHVLPEEADAIMERLPAYFSELVPIQPLAADASRLARESDHPIYDCFYLALARRENTALVTMDRELAGIAEQAGAEVELLAP
jgi:predicted nucleic acid-binding protein